MRINIVLDNVDTPSSITNFNLKENNMNISSLDNIVDDGEAQEIRAINILEYLPAEESEKVINYLLKKVKHKGQLIIGGIDLYEVCRAFVNSKIDVDEANTLIYGTEPKKQVGFTQYQLIEYLESKSVKIISKKVVNYNYIIILERA